MTALDTRNGAAVRWGDVPVLGFADFRNEMLSTVEAGGRLAALFGSKVEDAIRLTAVLARGNVLSLVSADVRGSFPSLTPDCPQAHLFEREIAETWGVTPQGHPWLKPVRFEKLREGSSPPGTMEFFRVEGEEVHEVAVGPVHAGVIEPGHFRFQCHGERVLHLEISLGYQHRGVEEILKGGPDLRTLPVLETASGDATIGHALAHCELLEALSGTAAPARARALRGIALELERLANHAGDLGALSGDVGFLPTASYMGRLRGDFLNMTALLCGNRFGRGFVVPGGVGYDLDEALASRLISRLEAALKDSRGALDLLWKSALAIGRFEETGTLPRAEAEGLGLVGPAARASGVPRDVRTDIPTGIYREHLVPPALEEGGDVMARARVRRLEMEASAAFIRERAGSLPEGPVRVELAPLAANSIAVSLVEGWRGEICHAAVTGPDGKFKTYKIVDPSFHNWMGLAMAMRGQEISDFPVCNKSFNLSYCGHDL